MGNFSSSEQQYDSSITHHYIQEANAYRRQLDDVIRENHVLKQYNQSILNDLQKLNRKLDEQKVEKLVHHTPSQRIVKKSISTDHLKSYVEEMLQNPEINIYGFPDAIEKQLYRNIFNMILNLLDHALENSEIKLLGHKIVFDIVPTPDTDLTTN